MECKGNLRRDTGDLHLVVIVLTHKFSDMQLAVRSFPMQTDSCGRLDRGDCWSNNLDLENSGTVRQRDATAAYCLRA